MTSEPTTERLATALEAAGAPPGMVDRARAGYYDDFKSELATPCIQLVADLRAAGLDELAARAIDGEFDGTPEESAAWFEAEGKDYLPQSMWSVFGYNPNQRPKPKGFG
jgi:hypothetical protein